MLLIDKIKELLSNIKLYDKRLSPYFDAVIAVLVLMFFATLFVPKSLWSEEDALREECRVRMSNLYELEIEFYRLVPIGDNRLVFCSREVEVLGPLAADIV